MARKVDSGWRDGMLAVKHALHGFSCPVAGMKLPMVEYDHGMPLALVNYIRRGEPTMKGADVVAAYRALGKLHRWDDVQMPFWTTEYDPRSWAYRVFPHNDAARSFWGPCLSAWQPFTEHDYATQLYRLRGRELPDLEPYGITFATSPWRADEPAGPQPVERWRGQFMSERRRNFEPLGQTRMGLRCPTVDVDFAVMDRGGAVSLVVDYKAPGATVRLGTTNMQALSGLYSVPRSRRTNVPAVVARYEPVRTGWSFHVHALNGAAKNLMAFALGHTGASDEQLAECVAGTEWVTLTEREWFDVLKCARDT